MEIKGKPVRQLRDELAHEREQVDAAKTPLTAGELGAVVSVNVEGGHKLTRAGWLKPGEVEASVERRIYRECRNAKWEQKADEADIRATVDAFDFSDVNVDKARAQEVCAAALAATPSPEPMTTRSFFSDVIPILPPMKERRLPPLPPIPPRGAASPAPAASPEGAPAHQPTQPPTPAAAARAAPEGSAEARAEAPARPDAAAPAALWGPAWDER